MVVEWPNISRILLYFIFVLGHTIIQTLDLIHAETYTLLSCSFSRILSLSHQQKPQIINILSFSLRSARCEYV